MVAQAPPLTLSRATMGDLQLDHNSLERYTTLRGVSLNGTVRTSTVIVDGVEADLVDANWLEPPPELEPVARHVAGLRVRTDGNDRVGIVTPIEVFSLDQGQLIRAVHYTLTLAIGTTSEWHILRWWLEPGGADATLRADGLAFLEALHQPGELELVGEQGERIAVLRIEGASFDPELRAARSFIEEVAALEEWTGTKIPLPLHADPEQVADVARAAAIVRARVVPLTVGDELTLTVRPTTEDATGDIDTLLLPREIRAEPLGVDVHLGDAEIVAAVTLVAREPLSDGLVRLRCRLSDDQPRTIVAHLSPPPQRSRSVRRTLVGGAPLPPDGLVSVEVADGLRQRALGAFIAAELGDRDLAPELLAAVEAKWPE